MNFTNVGYLSFNKKYNKELQSGALTCSMTVSDKNEDGSYNNSYMNCIIPKKCRTPLIEKILKDSSNNEKTQLLSISGIIKMNGKYVDGVIFDVTPYDKDVPKKLPF